MEFSMEIPWNFPRKIPWIFTDFHGYMKHLAVTRCTSGDPVLPGFWMDTFPMHPDEKLNGFEQLSTKEK